MVSVQFYEIRTDSKEAVDRSYSMLGIATIYRQKNRG